MEHGIWNSKIEFTNGNDEGRTGHGGMASKRFDLQFLAVLFL